MSHISILFIILCQISWVLINMCQIYWLNHFHDFHYVSYFHILIFCGTLACKMSILTKRNKSYGHGSFSVGYTIVSFGGIFLLNSAFCFERRKPFFGAPFFFIMKLFGVSMVLNMLEVVLF